MRQLKLAKHIPFVIDHIPADSIIRPGHVPCTKKYVVIHNTGNYDERCDAAWHNGYIHGQAASPSPREASWHFTVDDKLICEHIPVHESAWHAGDTSFGQGNYYGIGIEICVNGFPGVYEGEAYEKWEPRFLAAIDNAAVLTAALLKLYSLDLSAVKQHYDFAPEKKNCPQQMRYDFSTKTFTRETGTLYNLFMQKTEEYFNTEGYIK